MSDGAPIGALAGEGEKMELEYFGRNSLVTVLTKAQELGGFRAELDKDRHGTWTVRMEDTTMATGLDMRAAKRLCALLFSRFTGWTQPVIPEGPRAQYYSTKPVPTFRREPLQLLACLEVDIKRGWMGNKSIDNPDTAWMTDGHSAYLVDPSHKLGRKVRKDAPEYGQQRTVSWDKHNGFSRTVPAEYDRAILDGWGHEVYGPIARFSRTVEGSESRALVFVNAYKLRLAVALLGDCETWTNWELDPVLFVRDGEVIGVLMPMRPSDWLLDLRTAT